MKAELLSREQLAERFGVDVRTITNWVQADMPQRTRSGRTVYAWSECRDWWERKIRDDGRAGREVDGDEDKKKEMAELRLREQRATTEDAELALAERRRSLVTVDFMATEFARMADAMRGKLLSIPSAWSPRLDECTSTVDRMQMLSECVNELLPLLGGAADDDGEEEAA